MASDNKTQKKQNLEDILSSIDLDSKPLAPAPTPIPEGAALNPSYKEGSAFPKYMPAQAANEPGLEEPMIDPINLAATAATGGLSSVGPAVMNAAKNSAKSAVAGSLLDRIKAAAQARQDRMTTQGVGGFEPPTQIGQNTMYQPGSSPINYQQQILEQLRNRGKLGSGI